ncbi:transforming growth factor beta-1 proprotein-like [Ochotona princeps]|uniref:transforming growth factor beta-1 proprotein-like n=1 Tax=Ochotona princeps TaxID=9978 RepID=UPI002714AAAF|nr:transforming growth factor beta-1 proprotein-like [Ochotona princeps]
MLRTGLQMLPLLWLLLWTSKLGLSKPLSSEDPPVVMVYKDMPIQGNGSHEEVPTKITEEDTVTDDDLYDYNVFHLQMVEIKNPIYKQFRKSPHSVYMVFNKTELREAVPNPSLLYWAELHLYRRKQFKEQLVAVYEKCKNNTWHYLSYRPMAPSNKLDKLYFDVTEVVRRWLNQEDDIEVFRLRSQGFANYKDSVLQMDIIGITPSSDGDISEADSLSRPFLILLTFPPEKTKHDDSSQHP